MRLLNPEFSPYLGFADLAFLLPFDLAHSLLLTVAHPDFFPQSTLR